ncbi:hypothetical protein [Pseudomonas veronii]
MLLVLAGLCLVWVLRAIPETHPVAARGTSLVSAFKAYGVIVRSPRALGYILCMGLTFAGMFAFITASPFIYIQYFGVAPQHYAWLFALNIGGTDGINQERLAGIEPERRRFIRDDSGLSGSFWDELH